MEKGEENPLLSNVKSTSGLQVILHPLVLLTISDYITRHVKRHQEGPIVCGLLGQTNGREITIEHAFDCQVLVEPGGEVMLADDWFCSRLEQMQQVHQDRQLDLVGWSTILPQSGPHPQLLIIHYQILQLNESAVLLGFHPEPILNRTSENLPVTIYESHFEVEGASSSQDDGEDHAMKDSGADGACGSKLKVKFSELAYSVETSEAEMISIDTVAKTATSAVAIVETSKGQEAAGGSGSGPDTANSSSGLVTEGKGKKRMLPSRESSHSGTSPGAAKPIEGLFTHEEEQIITSLTAKANAVKMLLTMVKVLESYLSCLPNEFVSGNKAGVITDEMRNNLSSTSTAVPDYSILRSVQALVNRLPLVVPSNEEAFNHEVQSETNDVKLLENIRDVLGQTSLAKSIGRKVFLVAQTKEWGGRLPPDFAASEEKYSSRMTVGDLMT